MLGDKHICFSDYNFVLIDVETCSLNTIVTQPWQVAWIQGDKKKNNEMVNKFPHWPGLKVSKGAAAITGFNMNDYLDKSEDPKPIFEDLCGLLKGDDLIVGHNFFSFDSQVLVSTCRRLGIGLKFSDFQYRVIDTLALARAYKSGIPYSGKTPEDLFLWQIKVLNMKDRPRGCGLEAIARELGVNTIGNFHDALFDIKVNAEVFRKLMYELKI